jgi:hypothetical protein
MVPFCSEKSEVHKWHGLEQVFVSKKPKTEKTKVGLLTVCKPDDTMLINQLSTQDFCQYC